MAVHWDRRDWNIERMHPETNVVLLYLTLNAYAVVHHTAHTQRPLKLINRKRTSAIWTISQTACWLVESISFHWLAFIPHLFNSVNVCVYICVELLQCRDLILTKSFQISTPFPCKWKVSSRHWTMIECRMVSTYFEDFKASNEGHGMPQLHIFDQFQCTPRGARDKNN